MALFEMRPYKFLFLIYCFFIDGIASQNECPGTCKCKIDEVKCSSLGLTEVPKVSPEIRSLDLRLNNIEEIKPGSLGTLTHLDTLFLNDNKIKELRSGCFQNLTQLSHLYLYNNHISVIDPDVFSNMPQLKLLNLHMNEIHQIHPETFSNMPSLEKLSLYENEISKIPEGSFSSLPRLKRLRLDGNPLYCQCSLGWYIKLKNENRRINVTATCQAPKDYKGLDLKYLRVYIDCEAPAIGMPPEDKMVLPGGRIIMICIAHGQPSPDVVWYHDSVEMTTIGPRHRIISKGFLAIYDVEPDDSGIYECKATNVLGVAHSQAKLKVLTNIQVKPRFMVTPDDVVLRSGQTRVRFDCHAEASPAPHYSWFLNNTRIPLDDHNHVERNGSLTIEPVTRADVGTYTCLIENLYGKIQANASLVFLISDFPILTDLNEPPCKLQHLSRCSAGNWWFTEVGKPTIMEVPERQTVIAGDMVILKCQVFAEPPATITWYINDKILITDDNIIMTDDGRTLTIKEASTKNTAQYTCTAENTQGFAYLAVSVDVSEYSPTPPRIISKPESLETFKETIVQFACEVESDAPTSIEWRKDGLEVTLNNRTAITFVGSLVITNVTITDAGTYQCKAYNEFGHDTASATLKVKENILPREEYINVALTEALNDVDAAINKTMEALFNKKTGKVDLHDYFRISRFPNAPARDIARAAEIYERTLIKVRQYMENGLKLESIEEFRYDKFLSPKHLDLIARLSGCTAHREDRNCSDMSYHTQYRSIDGSCNNLVEPLWGSSLTAFRRILPPIYENGFSEPVGWNRDLKYNGYILPSARLVSNKLLSTINITEDLTITHMTMQWGQWLDHDLDHALPSVSSRTWDGVDCKKTCENAAPCFPIDVPENDPRIRDRRCIDFIRTSSVCGSGYTSVLLGKLQAREQINQLTSFIDASQVYGFENAVAMDLRDFTNDKGLLRVGARLSGKKPFLPTIGTNGMDCRRNLEESSRNCFVAGDIRANEQVGLAAMHTIWMREHNKIATQLKKINPFWSGDKVYQEARKIVGAEMQYITYEQWLPLILGPEGHARLGKYKGYNDTLNPSVSNVFATAALRFGHSLINPVLHRLDENFEPISKGHLMLRHAFFSPWRLADEGGVDPLIRGMFVTPAKLKTPSQNLNSELTENLFETAHAVALDLAAINIQRSREHGIPFYTRWRQFCSMKPVDTFDDLKSEISSKDVRDKLEAVYGSPHNIDVWVGGILEDQVKGGKVGPLFRCLLTEQFLRLRDGDRLWFENPLSFKAQQLEQIKKTSLARILCDNGDTIDTINENVFLLPEIQDGLVACDDIPTMDLQQWAEFEDCDDCTEDYDQ